MIFTFRLVSDEVDNFKREIKIDSTDNFLSLRNAICDCVGYDKGQMSSFFICDRNWEKKKEITLEDMGTDPDQDIWIMEETELGELLDDKGQRLLFVFDYLTDRSFFMELVDVEPGKSLKDPFCSLSLGVAPDEAVDIHEFENKIDAKSSASMDLDEDFYGSDQYNDDEFDAEGLDEMNFEP